MPLLLREDDGPIAVLTLNSPGSFNALSMPMLAALRAELTALASNEAIRVVVLRGAGRAFCAGHDLKEMQAARSASDQGADYFAGLFGRCADVMAAIVALPQVVIAQVQGVATAAGCQLVASCDMAVADEAARFGVNGINIGLFCSTPGVALSRAVAAKAAFEMLVTGDFISATRALALGLVNRVVPPEALEAETRALAQQVAGKLGPALRLGKAAFRAQAGLGLAEAYAVAGAAMVQNALLDDTAEGFAAFLERRPPGWKA